MVSQRPRQGWREETRQGMVLLNAWVAGGLCWVGRVSFQTVPGSDKTHQQLNVDLPEAGKEPGAVSAGSVAGLLLPVRGKHALG